MSRDCFLSTKIQKYTNKEKWLSFETTFMNLILYKANEMHGRIQFSVLWTFPYSRVARTEFAKENGVGEYMWPTLNQFRVMWGKKTLFCFPFRHLDGLLLILPGLGVSGWKQLNLTIYFVSRLFIWNSFCPFSCKYF